MAILPIITAPDPRLKVVSEPVAAVDDDLRHLIDDMLETMYDAPGIGLAAVQVGVPKRVLVIDIGDDDDRDTRNSMVFVNPEIVTASDDYTIYNEGCLSVPDYYAEVERPAEVTVRYLDRGGRAQELHATDLLATCIQHEMDHLEGILFVDHLSNLKRSMILRKLRKTQRLAAPAG
ncbi:MAG: peptide deformylase [Sphingomonadales bacterium]